MYPVLIQAQVVTCVDSIHLNIVPVSCHSFRDGQIIIEEVFSTTQQGPFFFSIDGATFSTRPVFDRLKAGTYQLTVRDSLDCLVVKTIEVPEPAALFVRLHAPTVPVVAGELFEVSATFEPPDAAIVAVNWRPPSYFAQSDSLRHEVAILTDVPFAIELTDKSGCTARDQTWVYVRRPDIFFPNIIQIGSNQNAYFTAFTGEGVKMLRLLEIYDRNGGKVFNRKDFQPNDPLLGWNGRVQGKKVMLGVYTWRAVIELNDGTLLEQVGTLTVI
jgi:hypothetical protein